MLLDLPSSASAVDFADNTNSNFKVRLPQKLVLEPGECEVGAVVAHILNNFYNIVAGDVTLQLPMAKQTYNVTPGFYRIPDSLLAEMRKATLQWKFEWRSASSLISIGYNKTTNKVEMNIVGDVEMTFGDDLCGALGLAHGAHVSETSYVPSLCSMFFGLSYLFVYTNLIRGRMVGDSQTPLLRAIPVYGIYGDATHEFSTLYRGCSIQQRRG